MSVGGKQEKKEAKTKA